MIDRIEKRREGEASLLKWNAKWNVLNTGEITVWSTLGWSYHRGTGHCCQQCSAKQCCNVADKRLSMHFCFWPKIFILEIDQFIQNFFSLMLLFILLYIYIFGRCRISVIFYAHFFNKLLVVYKLKIIYKLIAT